MAHAHDEKLVMSNHVYKQGELIDSSASSTDDAIRQAIETATKKLRHICWFEVSRTRGRDGCADG
jgi:dodecin